MEINNNLTAQKRFETGKGNARRLRANSQLPAVLYAKNSEAISLTVSPKIVTKILQGPYKRNTVIDLAIDGENDQRMVMVKERQIHPTRRSLIHVDFVEVDMNKPVVVAVPVNLFGKSESVTLGGKMEHVLQKMRISCLPKSIPQSIDIDITDLPFGSTHTKDITLPEGISLAEKPRVVILTIKRPRGAKDEGTEAAATAKK